MQGVIPNVGHSSDIMNGHSEDDVLSVSPHQLYVVSRQTHYCVLLRCQLARQLMGLLCKDIITVRCLHI